MKPQSFLSSLFHSAIWSTTGRGASLIKHVVIAAAIGLSTQLDVFYMAMAILGLLMSIWAEIMEVLVLPQLVALESAGRKREFRRIAGGVFLLALIASVAMCFVVIPGRDVIAGFAIGFDAARQDELARAFFWFIPYILLVIPLGALNLVLRAKRLFSWFHQANALIPVIVLVCIIVAPDHPSVLFWSISLGTIAAFMYAGMIALRHIDFAVNPFDKTILHLFKIVPALLVLNSAYFCFLFMDRVFASFLAVGAISAIAYGMTIALIITELFNLGGGFMTVAAEKQTREARAATLDDLLSLVILLSAGATAFMFFAGEDVVAVLLERGAFGTTDTDAVACALTAFAFIIAPMFVWVSINQLFQIEKRIGMMVVRTLAGIVVGAVLNYIAIFVLEWGIFGLALATTVSFWLITFLGIIGLMRIGYPIAILRHLKWLGWCGVFLIAGIAGIYLLPDMPRLADIIATAVIIGMALLSAGMTWQGHERALLRQVIGRVLRV